MLIPKRPTLDLTAAEVEAIINQGKIDFAKLDGMIPKGLPNLWSAKPTDRIKFGFKYEWTSPAPNGTKWHFHGHAPDPQAPGGANASNGWIIRIQCNKKYLMDTPSNPPVGVPSNWTRNVNAYANQTHIQTTSETMKRGRSNSF